jgi:hypothetical protein
MDLSIIMVLRWDKVSDRTEEVLIWQDLNLFIIILRLEQKYSKLATFGLPFGTDFGFLNSAASILTLRSAPFRF